MSDQKLKTCPFCQEHLEWCTDLCGFVHQGESFCVASGLLIDKTDADRWNTRTPDPILEELAGALEKALDHGLFKREHLLEISHVWEKYQQSKVTP